MKRILVLPLAPIQSHCLTQDNIPCLCLPKKNTIELKFTSIPLYATHFHTNVLCWGIQPIYYFPYHS